VFASDAFSIQFLFGKHMPLHERRAYIFYCWSGRKHNCVHSPLSGVFLYQHGQLSSNVIGETAAAAAAAASSSTARHPASHITSSHRRIGHGDDCRVTENQSQFASWALLASKTVLPLIYA